MKAIKRIFVSLICLVITASACVVFAGAKGEVKAQPKVKGATVSTITLSWSKIKGAGGYYVYKSVDGKWKKISDTNKVTYTAKGLTASESYKFAVRHYTIKNGKKTLAKAYGTVEAKTKSLSKVSSFKAVTNANSITLSWGRLSGATGYRIYMKNSVGKWVKLITLGSSTTKYEVKKSSAFDKFTFRIRPYAKTTKGVVWGQYTSCTAPIDKNKAPNILSADTTACTATISWKQISEASGYRIYTYSEKEGYTLIGKTYGEASTVYTAEKLSSDTEYCFVVKAFRTIDGVTSYSRVSDKYWVSTQKANLDVYRSEQISELLCATEFYIEYSEQDKVYGKVDSVMALRMGKLYLKETVNGKSTQYIYDTVKNEVYIIDSANRQYRIANDSEEYDIKLAALHEHMKIENMSAVQAKYKNGLICESFTEEKYDRYMELSFLGEDSLSEIYIKYADGSESVIAVSCLKENTDSSLFEIPKGYTLVA